MQSIKLKVRPVMPRHQSSSERKLASILTITALFCIATVSPSVAGGTGDALLGVSGINAIFDYSQGSPKMSTIIFGAVKDLYTNEAVKALPEKPRLIILFQGPAVKLITSDRSGFDEKDVAELDKFQSMIREMKNDGVRMEVCRYAAKVLGIDPATILPEIDHVDNGFISSIGYQAQGYALVRVP